MTFRMSYLVASGGRGLGWVFLAPVTLVAIWIVDDSVPWPVRGAAQQIWIVDVGIVALCVLLWYFLVGRIPNWHEVATTKRQVLDATAAYGVDVFSHPSRSAQYQVRFNGVRANVAIVTPKDIQLWAGKGDSARPVANWKWGQIDSVTTAGSGSSTLVAVKVQENELPYILSLVENRMFASTRIRGRARTRLIERLEALRVPEKPSYKVI